LAHEIGRLSTCRDELSKLVDKELKPYVSWLRRSLDAKADREQLFTNAVHLIRFPTEVIVNRWVAERSGNLLKESLENARSVWREAKNGKLPYAVGGVLHGSKIYLSMRLRLSLAQQYQIDNRASTISTASSLLCFADHPRLLLVFVACARGT